MRKQIFAVYFLFLIGFACDSPNIIKFRNEFGTFGDNPRIVAAGLSDFGQKMEFAVLSLPCNKKPSGLLEKTQKAIIASNFVKNILKNNPEISAPLIVGSEIAMRLVDAALTPEVLGYSGTKKAMAAAISAASSHSCESQENAAKFYYSYTLNKYYQDVCSNKNPIDLVINILGKPVNEKKTVKLVATSEDAPATYYLDIQSIDPLLAESVKLGKLSRSQALKKLARGLDALPLCHEVSNDIMKDLLVLADSDSPLFFPLYYALRDYRENCSLNYSGYYLQEIKDGVVYFSNGSNQIPVAFLIEKDNKSVVELIPQRVVNFSGILPVDGEDVALKDFTSYKGVVPRDAPIKLSASYILIPLLLGFLALRWKNEKNS